MCLYFYTHIKTIKEKLLRDRDYKMPLMFLEKMHIMIYKLHLNIYPSSNTIKTGNRKIHSNCFMLMFTMEIDINYTCNIPFLLKK